MLRIYLFVLPLLVVSVCLNTSVKAQQVLQFPEDRSLGEIYIRPVSERESEDFRWYASSQWQLVGFAQGRVEIPPDCFVRLDVSEDACKDLGPLEVLPSDSIHYLEFNTDMELTKQLQSVGALTGLKGLRFRSEQIVDEGIEQLAKLRNLEYLVCSAERGNGFTDAGLEVIGNFHRLQTLDLRGNRITDEGLPSLATCNSLESLSLEGTMVTGTGLDSLLMLPNLKRLSLGVVDEGSPVDDEGLEAISQLRYLTSLRLSGTRITDDGLMHLGAMERLEHLTIDYTDVTDEGLENLEDLKTLRTLRFYKNSGSLEDEAAEHLSKLPNLERVSAEWKLTSEGIKKLADFKKLTKVRLTDSVQDHDLDSICAMESLEDLHLSDCPITDRGIEKLTALKNLKILTLNSCGTPKCIASVSAIPSLTHLRIYFDGDDHTGLQWPDNDSWKLLSNLTELESLAVSGLLLSDQNWQAISELKNLRQLSIDNRLVLTSSFFEAIQNLDQLGSLEVEEVIAGPEDLQRLSMMKELQFLRIRGSFDDNDLDILADLPAIKSIQIASDNITKEGLNRFRAKVKTLQRISHHNFGVGTSFSLNEDGIVQNYCGSMRDQLDAMIGQPAPPIALEGLVNVPGGGVIDLDGYRGHVVLVDCFRSHVGHSRDDNVIVKKIYEKYKDRGLKVVGIHTTRDGHRLADFVAHHGITWPCGIDKDNQTADAWNTNRRYGIYLLDKEGNVRMANIYPGDLERALEVVLGESE